MAGPQFDIGYTAQLARLELSAEERARFADQLGEVLAYVAKLGQLDVADIEPTAHTFPLANVLRDDRERPGLPAPAALANAPHQANDLFIVTKVVE